jgi:hypothetical protein
MLFVFGGVLPAGKKGPGLIPSYPRQHVTIPHNHGHGNNATVLLITRGDKVFAPTIYHIARGHSQRFGHIYYATVI